MKKTPGLRAAHVPSHNCSGARLRRISAALLLVFFQAVASLAADAAAQPGFRSLFDGRTLDGWNTPNPRYWTVEDGTITGRITRENPCATNQYLVWAGGELADFELKVRSRLNGEGGINNGFQFRSRLLPDHDVCGYQLDNNLRTDWRVRLYDEYGRHVLAMPGERAVFDSSGARTLTQLPGASARPAFRLEDWHEYHLTCVGPRMTLRVNDELIAEIEDNDPRRRELEGILALQLHSGPPTVAQFKDIRLKILKAAPPRESVVVNPARAGLFRDALASWALDAGGHGANPPVRLVPQFYQFEMNVRPDGPGARPGSKVTLLDGAYFDAGKQLHAQGDQVTVYLRARDPRGSWNAGLFAKRGGHDRVHLNLFGADLPDTPGADIGFELRTTTGFFMVSFPVSRIDALAWHDLVGRFDGKAMALFCDGRLMVSRPASGAMITNSEPLLIGAETDNGKVVRHFRGEVQEAALWPRALTDAEIADVTTTANVR